MATNKEQEVVYYWKGAPDEGVSWFSVWEPNQIGRIELIYWLNGEVVFAEQLVEVYQ